MDEGHRKETVFIFEWTKLPQEQKDYIKFRFDYFFRNDIHLKFHSEFEPCGDEDGKDWSETLSRESIAEYHKDQVETNGFEGDLDKFIKDYGLEFEVWMLDQELDLKGVKLILIDICW